MSLKILPAFTQFFHILKYVTASPPLLESKKSIWITVTNTIYWVAYKPQKFKSFNSAGRDAQDQNINIFSVWLRACFMVHNKILSFCYVLM